jgi:hypothetical protein
VIELAQCLSACQRGVKLRAKRSGRPCRWSTRADARCDKVAVDRLAQLSEQGCLSSDHVRLTAETLGVAERTVWRWLSARRLETPAAQRERFRVDDRLRVRLAYWRGNAAALQRELAEQHRAGGPPAPSVSTVQRAILRDLTPGERAGLRRGERERRKFDVFLKRPVSHRKQPDHQPSISGLRLRRLPRRCRAGTTGTGCAQVGVVRGVRT